jgi:hypothetical protein
MLRRRLFNLKRIISSKVLGDACLKIQYNIFNDNDGNGTSISFRTLHVIEIGISEGGTRVIEHDS